MKFELGQQVKLDYILPEYNEEVYVAKIVSIEENIVTLERSGVPFDRKFLNLL